MSKELEYLEKEIKDLEIKLEKDIKLRDKLTVYQHRDLENCFSRISKYENRLKQLNIIKQALQRLEVIENSNPSEAIKSLEEIKKDWKWCLNTPKIYQDFEIVKQSLLKAQEQEKVLNQALKLNGELAEELDDKNEELNIIKEKYADLVILRDVDTVEKYNKYIKLSYCRKELTQEEFELLKRYCDKKDRSEV